MRNVTEEEAKKFIKIPNEIIDISINNNIYILITYIYICSYIGRLGLGSFSIERILEHFSGVSNGVFRLKSKEVNGIIESLVILSNQIKDDEGIVLVDKLFTVRELDNLISCKELSKDNYQEKTKNILIQVLETFPRITKEEFCVREENEITAGFTKLTRPEFIFLQNALIKEREYRKENKSQSTHDWRGNLIGVVNLYLLIKKYIGWNLMMKEKKIKWAEQDAVSMKWLKEKTGRPSREIKGILKILIENKLIKQLSRDYYQLNLSTEVIL